jgi:hypothetical protein
METRYLHVDEISVWSWVAAAAFALIALAAVLMATHENMRVTGLSTPALPFAQPAMLPPETIAAGPRA